LVKLRATQQGGRTQQDPAIARAVEQIDRYLSVTQLGITLASLGLGWIGEPTIAHLLNDWATRITGHPITEGTEHVLEGLAFAFITFGHVLLGELVPKLIAIQRSQAIAKMAVLPLRLTFYLLLPALWLLENSSKAILGLFGMQMDMHSEAALSEEEILGVLAAQVARGPGGEHKEDLLRRVVRFGSRLAKQAMIPRVDVFYLPLSTDIPTAVERLRNMQFSRVPLSKEGTNDQISGYVYWKDLVTSTDGPPASLEAIMRPVLYVAEAESLVDVLRKMQREKIPFAVVVDEYGGTSGILTMEDLLEEIVGEIRDELDEEMQRIEQREGKWEVDGSVLLDELHEAGVKVEDDERQSTIGAALVSRLERLPRVGDRVEIGGVTAEVIGLVRRRVTRVRLHPPS
ncbi:MAG: hemolysin family protein, partial [Polyangiaceae bacterium]